MCGICGIYRTKNVSNLGPYVQEMADSIRHRGPDSSGIWSDPSCGIALGHRRLAILDTSDTGAQPMTSECGRWRIVFNGEIYNHLRLRGELEEAGKAPSWQGTSDTETLLAVVAAEGVKNGLRRAFGMFALAIWDHKDRCLYLARDRMGEKPLYCAQFCDGWAFASELKSLLAFPDFRPQLNQKAIAAYLAYGYVPDNQCIFNDAFKVPAGHFLRINSCDSVATSELSDAIAFQPFSELMDEGLAHRQSAPPFSREKATEELETKLMHVVEEQMISDVPLGCFLSGGIDSSLIASLMQAQSEKQIKTFSIGFDINRFNEAPHAAAVASHLGTEHIEINLKERDALSVVSGLAEIYDEPFADSSQIPTVLLCREARKGVTVALTGDGGDEVFGGYNRHIMSEKLSVFLGRLSRPVRQAIGSGLTLLEPIITKEESWLRRLATITKLPVTAIDKSIALAPVLSEVDTESLYRHFTRNIDQPNRILSSETEEIRGPRIDHLSDVLGTAEWMMAMDSVSYLPGDILVKVDRAAMAASLETRAPFLDSRIVSFAWYLPLEYKINKGRGKSILRDILNRHVPATLVDRPKQGFAVPIDEWLRGPLKSWADALINDDDLLAISKLDPLSVKSIWDNHQHRIKNNGAKLWSIIMLLQWVREYKCHLND